MSGPQPLSCATRMWQCLLRSRRPLHKHSNERIDARTTRAEYVAFRKKRDASLPAPVLILPSLQVNIRAGELPPPEDNGVSYLKIPLNRLGLRSS